MDQTPNHHIFYQSYLLRLWCDELGGVLRITLQSAITQQLHYFSGTEELLSFLSKLSNSPNPSPDQPQATVQPTSIDSNIGR